MAVYRISLLSYIHFETLWWSHSTESNQSLRDYMIGPVTSLIKIILASRLTTITFGVRVWNSLFITFDSGHSVYWIQLWLAVCRARV
jgi:hypothetical protein